MIKIVEMATRVRVIADPTDTAYLQKVIVGMRYQPPDYWRADSYQVWKNTNGERGWDGYHYPLKTAGTRTVAEAGRGHLDEILSRFADYGVELDTSKMLPRPFADITPDDIPDDLVTSQHELDEHQRRGVAEWIKHAMGVCQVTVGGGKTMMFASAIAFVKRRYPSSRWLYLVPTERLVRQATGDLKGFLPDFTITQFGGGKPPPRDDNGNFVDPGGDIIVATVATLHANFVEFKVRGFFKTFMGLLVDECHHAPSPSWMKSILETPAFWRFGASDSTREKDVVRGTAVRGLCGPIRSETEADRKSTRLNSSH